MSGNLSCFLPQEEMKLKNANQLERLCWRHSHSTPHKKQTSSASNSRKASIYEEPPANKGRRVMWNIKNWFLGHLKNSISDPNACQT